MSDNVSKFDPHPGKSIARRIVLFVLALVLVGGAVTLYVFRDSLNLDAAKRFVRYLNVKTDSAGGSFTFDSHNANQYADLQGGLAVASVSGLSLYDANGDELAVVQAKLDTPAIRTGAVSYTHLRAHETGRNLVCRLLLEKKKNKHTKKK